MDGARPYHSTITQSHRDRKDGGEQAVWFYFYRLVGSDVNECVPQMYCSGLRGGKDGALRGNKKIRGGGPKCCSWSWCSDVICWAERGSSQVCFLAARQAAHLTVLCARLVHEGAVKAGPHS